MIENKTFWYISKYFSPKTETSPGGRGWFLMIEAVNAGHRPVVITSDSNNLTEMPALNEPVFTETIDGIMLIWLRTIKYEVAKSYKRIFSWFHFEWKLFRLDIYSLPKPDTIVVSSLSLLTILNGIRLKRKFSCRLIFEVRDIWPLTIIEEGHISSGHPFVRFLAWVERLGYDNSDAIIGTMPNLEEHVRQVSSSNTPVYCIPMGIALDQINYSLPLDGEYIEKYLSSKKFKILYAGTIGTTNALEVFFKSAEILKNNTEFQFILVGDGPLKQFFIKRYEHLPNLVFAPKVNKYQVQTVLLHSDVVYFSVFDSKVWKYGQSLNKVIDYMLSGKPIVASYSGYPSMINEAGCGVFVPSENAQALADALIMLKKVPAEERTAMGKRGREWLLCNRPYEHLGNKFVEALFP